MKIGIQELLLVFIVALIVLGPDKLPVYARRLGEGLREFRRFSSDATKDIRESIVEPLEEAQRPLKEALEPITDLQKEIKGEVAQIQQSISDIGRPSKKETVAAAEKTDDAGTDRLGSVEADNPQVVQADSAETDSAQTARSDTAAVDSLQAAGSDRAEAEAPQTVGQTI